MPQPERGRDPVPEGGVPGAAGELLDHPPGEYEAGVAVGPGGAERVVLGHLAEERDVLLQAVVAATGVGEDVAVDPAGVREQVPHGHPLGHLRIGQPQLRQDGADRSVEIEPALVDQLHHHGRRPHLGDRADLEHRVGGHLDPGLHVQHAVRRLGQFVRAILAQPQDSEYGTGDAMPLGEYGQPALPVPGVDRRAAPARVPLDPVHDPLVVVGAV
nr:hypothetical protein [Plantactinospora sp. BC1]